MTFDTLEHCNCMHHCFCSAAKIVCNGSCSAMFSAEAVLHEFITYSFGVVYGDLSTSPFYAYKSIFCGKLRQYSIRRWRNCNQCTFLHILDIHSY
ncbi:hypothetical protein PAHAL_7G117600 [Panicum hallii]|uniref:Uncharacterized protein n=1 Tax=Panicum hallii TaxID=206008 RepID=A0A2T8IBZ5_9POAL|nr:hypothetical protein PAHAL_7G117600 [Panicum hallii]